MHNIADIRKEYRKATLDERNVLPDAMEQFGVWWNEAVNSNIDEVNAMTLATIDAHEHPSARIVLLKGYREEGFIFFTNYESHKGNHLSHNPNAALVFFWKELERQIRISGTAVQLSAEESDEYYHSRPHESKIGAWASPQSKVIGSRQVIEEKIGEVSEKFSKEKIFRPPHWGGYIIRPRAIEFWQGRPGRLHDRILYTRIDHGWKIERLAP